MVFGASWFFTPKHIWKSPERFNQYQIPSAITLDSMAVRNCISSPSSLIIPLSRPLALWLQFLLLLKGQRIVPCPWTLDLAKGVMLTIEISDQVMTEDLKSICKIGHVHLCLCHLQETKMFTLAHWFWEEINRQLFSSQYYILKYVEEWTLLSKLSCHFLPFPGHTYTHTQSKIVNVKSDGASVNNLWIQIKFMTFSCTHYVTF